MSLMSDKWITEQCVESEWKALKKKQTLEQTAFGFQLKTVLIEEPRDTFQPMIEPFSPELVRVNEDGKRIISYGLSSYGYDARLAEELKLFTNINSSHIDPYDLHDSCYVDAQIQTDENGHRFAYLPPNSFMLGRTMEYFRIPRDVAVVCLGKSTWARSGVTVVVTPLEPEWEGQVVIEIANLTSLPVKIYTGVGICQFLFLQGDQPCAVSYKDRGGKYDRQTGITLPKV